MIIRKLLPGEGGRLQRHLLRLTHEDRTLRFMGCVANDVLAEYCADIDWARTVVVGFFSAGVLRGAAELHVATHQFSLTGEVAISVETAWQHRGIATELLSRVIVIASNRWSRTLEMDSLHHNYRIRQLARKFGARYRSTAGTSVAEIAVPAPTYLSLWRETIDDGFGWMSVWLGSTA